MTRNISPGSVAPGKSMDKRYARRRLLLLVRRSAIGVSAAVLVIAVVFSASHRMDTQLFASPDPVEALFAPVSQEPFFVYVGRSDRLAKRQFADYERLKTPETFQVLRGNVIAISDSGLRRGDRKRVRGAMRALVATDRT
jgi:hypothetical protein